MWSHPQHLGLLGRGWEWKRVCFLTGRPASLLHSSQDDPKGFKHTQPREWLFGPLRSCFRFLKILFVFQTSKALTYTYVWLIPNSGRVQIHFTLNSCAICLNEQQGILAYSLCTEPSGESWHCYLRIFTRYKEYKWGGGVLYTAVFKMIHTDNSINHE